MCWRADKPEGFSYEFSGKDWPLKNIVADADTMHHAMMAGRDLSGRKQPKVTPTNAEAGLRRFANAVRAGTPRWKDGVVSAATIMWLQKLGRCPADRHNGLLVVRPGTI